MYFFFLLAVLGNCDNLRHYLTNSICKLLKQFFFFFFFHKVKLLKKQEKQLKDPIQLALAFHLSLSLWTAGMRYGIIKEIHPESIKRKNCIQQSSDITAPYRSFPLSTFLINIFRYYLNPKLWPSCQWPCEQLYITGGTSNHKGQRKKKYLADLRKGLGEHTHSL